MATSSNKPMAKPSEKFKLRKVNFEDLPALEELNDAADFDIGMHNMELYFLTSPTYWDCVENEKGKIIGYNCQNYMTNGVTVGYTTLVKESYRGKGVARLIDAFQRLPGPYIGYTTHSSLVHFHGDFDVFEWNLLQFYGMIQPGKILHHNVSVSVEIKSATTEIFDSLMNYDKCILKLDRSKFMYDYIFPKDATLSTCLVAFDQNKIVGYGVLRKMSDYYSIQPCYADTSEIAEALLLALCKTMNLGDLLYIPCPSFSGATIKLAHDLGLAQLSTEVRECSRGAEVYSKTLDIGKAYALQEYWPL